MSTGTGECSACDRYAAKSANMSCLRTFSIWGTSTTNQLFLWGHLEPFLLLCNQIGRKTNPILPILQGPERWGEAAVGQAEAEILHKIAVFKVYTSNFFSILPSIQKLLPHLHASL